jgi:hypothetical protein
MVSIFPGFAQKTAGEEFNSNPGSVLTDRKKNQNLPLDPALPLTVILFSGNRLPLTLAFSSSHLAQLSDQGSVFTLPMILVG